MNTTIADLEKVLVTAAKLVKFHGSTYMPIFERIESELANAKEIEQRLDRAIALANQSTENSAETL